MKEAVTTIYKIGDPEASFDLLLLELGAAHCWYAYSDSGTRSIRFAQYSAFPETEAHFAVNELLQQIKTTSRSVICLSGPEALLVPQKFNETEAELLPAIYAGVDAKLLSDPVAEWQVTTAYQLERDLFDQLERHLPGASYVHAYTPMLRLYNGFVADQQVEVHFDTERFRVLVKKDSRLLLVQTYAYKSPLDVAYVLLKICYELGIDQSQVYLIVSGLVDRNSALFAELQHYFLNIHFSTAQGFSLPETDLPSYYFQSLINLASCAS